MSLRLAILAREKPPGMALIRAGTFACVNHQR